MVTSSTPTTRDRILDAAAEVMRTLGLARATTKEIARVAGYSEATLYKHFRNKAALFVAVMQERRPNFLVVLKGLTERVGQASVEGNLVELAQRAVPFYLEGVAMAGSLFAEPALLERHRAELRRTGAGPHRPNEALAGYLRAEQARGRIDEGVDPDVAAALLLGACYQRAFLRAFSGEGDPAETDRHFAEQAVRTLLRGVRRDE
jgi:AcrR family transcriptional regulator